MWKSYGVRKTFNEKEVNLLWVNEVYVVSTRIHRKKLFYVP